MASVTLEVVAEQVKALSVDEQRHLRQMLDDILSAANEKESERELHEHMKAEGLLAHIPPEPRRFRATTPIPVRGGPISRTIIEERR